MHSVSCGAFFTRANALLLLGAVVLLAACAKKLVVTGVPVYEEHWLATVNSLGPRAGSDLSCPPEELTWALYSRRGRLPFEVGTEGCGRRAVYLGSHENGWIQRPGSPYAPPLAQREARIIDVNGVEIFEHIWVDTMAIIIPKAERALGCPQSGIVVALRRKAGRIPMDVVASGCDRSLRYFRPLGFGPNGGTIGDWEPDGIPTATIATDPGRVGPAPTAP